MPLLFRPRVSPVSRRWVRAGARWGLGCLLASIVIAAEPVAYESIEPRFARQSAEGWADLSAVLERIREPTFPNRVVVVSDCGASPTAGAAENTAAIQGAIDLVHEQGGGRVVVPAGEWATFALRLKSGVNLHIAAGATLRFDPDTRGYPVVRTMWEGVELMNFSPLIYAYEAENIALTGAGTLDGSSSWDTWWDWSNRQKGRPFLQTPDRARLFEMAEAGVPVEERVFGPGTHLRPPFVQTLRCRGVLIEGVTLLRSPFWVLHPAQSENVTVRGVTVLSHGPNNDGCDPESSRDVLIENCVFDAGDDCIAIKSGRNADGRRVAMPTENVVVRNCHFRKGHGGLVIGSEISGGCQNVFMEDCTLDSPELDRVLRFKNNARRGGLVQNVFLRNLRVKQVRQAVLAIQFTYEEGARGAYQPVLRNARLEGIHCENTPSMLLLESFPGARIEDVVVADSTFLELRHPDVVQHGSVRYENLVLLPADSARAKLPWEK